MADMAGPPPPGPAVGLAELTWRLTRAARSRGSKQLFCAADVADALAARLPPAGPPEPPWSSYHDAGVINGLLVVDIIVTPDSPPGAFRLVRHYDPARQVISCEVHGETVSHHRCPVVFEGTLTGAG